MSKAILMIDMPSCCDECFALDDNGDSPLCLITQEQRGYNFRTREQKMSKCPLRPALEWKDRMIGNCFNCLHIEDGSKIGKDGWLNCLKWGAANINPYGFCHMWEPKRK